jgi:hypothetical protein
MFFLLSLIAYVKYIRTKKQKLYFYSLLLFLLSLLSKGQAVSLSLTVVAIDYFLDRKLLFRKVIFEKIPFFILSIAFGIIAIYAQSTTNTMQNNAEFLFYEKILFASFGFIHVAFPINRTVYN